MKQIQLNNHQTEALNNGCTMLWMPISREMKVYSRMKDYEENRLNAIIEGEVKPYDETKDLIKYSSPLQVGQEYIAQTAKEFECSWCKGKDPHCTDCYGKGKVWDIDIEIEFKVTDIQVKRVQDIVAIDGEFMDYVNSLKEDEYEDNPYGFLVTTERIK